MNGLGKVYAQAIDQISGEILAYNERRMMKRNKRYGFDTQIDHEGGEKD